ncbi:hypothetical protein BD779DRAFT_1507775 [Infundibulicybe gibba]|nr:hypothetical protein BD779DRAFT_1507775 [Infundibulicybe gibba]
MLQKAVQAWDAFHGLREPLIIPTDPNDELSIFGGRTKVINPHPPADNAPSRAPIPPQAILDSQHQHQTPQEVYAGWRGLFHEVPSHWYEHNPSPNTALQGSRDGLMLNDRWSSLMSSNEILGDGRS